MTTQIWHLTPDRAVEWRQIRLQALRDAPDAFDASDADWSGRPLADFAARLAQGRVFAAGPSPGRPLAVASWDRDMDADNPLRGWLMSMFVVPEQRGRGLADRLLGAVAQDAADHGMTSLGLNVRGGNLRAIRLYRRLGFLDSGRTGLVGASGAPEIEMTLKISVISPLPALERPAVTR